MIAAFGFVVAERELQGRQEAWRVTSALDKGAKHYAVQLID